jgi:anti-sigma regulatory factor (Ser/Thr protein kinase)
MITVTVTEQSQVAEARRVAAALAQQNGFGESEVGRVALVVTELATNLVKHGRGGEILVGTFADDLKTGLEIVALDQGPGIASVATCLEDGYSTAGTRGQGLGAIHRQSTSVEIATWPAVGTAILSRIAVARPDAAGASPWMNWGAVSIAMPGEEVCGDSWTVSTSGTFDTLMIADGLGHGQPAAEAAVEATRIFHRFVGHQVPMLLDYVHGGLRATRGAAVSIARFDRAAAKVIFAGIGNVSGVLVIDGELKRMVSMAGTAGHNARKIQAFEYPFRGGLIILHSDGLAVPSDLDCRGALSRFWPSPR